METPVRKVFYIIGVCMASLLLWNLIFIESRGVIWDAMRPAFETNWRMYTMEDGRLIEEELTDTFNKARDLST